MVPESTGFGGECAQPFGAALVGVDEQLARTDGNLLKRLVQHAMRLLREVELTPDGAVILYRAPFGIAVHDRGADGDGQQEHELEEVRPVKNLGLVRPQDQRQAEDHEGVAVDGTCYAPILRNC